MASGLATAQAALAPDRLGQRITQARVAAPVPTQVPHQVGGALDLRGSAGDAVEQLGMLLLVSKVAHGDPGRTIASETQLEPLALLPRDARVQRNRRADQRRWRHPPGQRPLPALAADLDGARAGGADE